MIIAVVFKIFKIKFFFSLPGEAFLIIKIINKRVFFESKQQAEILMIHVI
jgi:hypothetical protein